MAGSAVTYGVANCRREYRYARSCPADGGVNERLADDVHMSTDFIALFDASSPEITLEWLREKLIANPQFAHGIIEYFRDKWRVKNWEIEISQVTGAALLGPGGFVIRLEPLTMSVYQMTPFNVFSGDELWRSEIRNACFDLAEMVGSKRAIYTHELMPCGAGGLVQIENGLRETIGPPAATFEELHTAEYFGPRAWYIDEFDHLV